MAKKPNPLHSFPPSRIAAIGLVFLLLAMGAAVLFVELCAPEVLDACRPQIQLAPFLLIAGLFSSYWIATNNDTSRGWKEVLIVILWAGLLTVLYFV